MNRSPNKRPAPSSASTVESVAFDPPETGHIIFQDSNGHERNDAAMLDPGASATGSLLASSRGTLVFFHDFVCVCFLFFCCFFCVCFVVYVSLFLLFLLLVFLFYISCMLFFFGSFSCFLAVFVFCYKGFEASPSPFELP